MKVQSITSITLIWCTILVMISTVSGIFFSKTGGYPYGSAVSNVRPDYAVPYSNYGLGYGYQGLSSFNTRPYNTFGNTGYGSSYSFPQNTGFYGFNNPFYGQSSLTSPYGYSSGSYYNQNPYYGRPYSFYPPGTVYKS